MAHNYKSGRKWLEIIKYREEKKKEETPTERIMREFDEGFRLERTERVTVAEVEGMIPKLKELIADEEGAIQKYQSFLELIKRTNFATGMLEGEVKKIERILDDEKKHKKELEEILRQLTY